MSHLLLSGYWLPNILCEITASLSLSFGLYRPCSGIRGFFSPADDLASADDLSCSVLRRLMPGSTMVSDRSGNTGLCPRGSLGLDKKVSELSLLNSRSFKKKLSSGKNVMFYLSRKNCI